jgi:hypothetical protein
MRGESEKIGDHPWEDLANSGYKLDMMHNFFLIILLYFWLLTLDQN